MNSSRLWSLRVDSDHLSHIPARDRAEKVLLALLALDEEISIPSRSYLQKLIEQSLIQINGKLCAKELALNVGDLVEIRFPAPTPLEVMPENLPLEILYQDEHLVVVSKPQGLTVHPSETQATGTLVHALLFHVKDLSGIGGVSRPGIVHRLDKGTSGILVVSKSDEAHRKLVEMFSLHRLTRRYLALCYGVPKWPRGKTRVETQLGRNPKDRKKMAVLKAGGRKAVTHFAVKEEFRNAALVEAELETGRTHQVRVHLTHLGHSILGDPTYGEPTTSQPKWKVLPTLAKDLVRELPAQALHAYHLEFDHPISGQHLVFTSSPPEAFEKLMTALRESS